MLHYVIKFVSAPCTLVSFINKTDRHDITEILLKVAFNTVTITISIINRNYIKTNR